jgi:hypothetical protein
MRHRPSSSLCQLRSLPLIARFATIVVILALASVAGVAQDTLIANLGPSDHEPASILFYTKYTSSQTSPQTQDTQINITNVNREFGTSLHLFMVDGSTCTVADFFLSLTANQTGTFYASDLDPGITGYIFAVASNGTPTQFNFLIGDAYVRENDGKQANLQAWGFEKHSPGDVAPNGDGTATIIFNGIEYDRKPSMLAASNFNSQVDHSTNLALVAPMTNYLAGNPANVNVFTLVYNDVEEAFSTTLLVRCLRQIPLLTLRVSGGNVNAIVKVGRTGWIRLNAINAPILGSILQRGPIFTGGHNLHPIALLPTFSTVVPAF